jgi:tetratricopeptide (TPR) repeat protein
MHCANLITWIVDTMYLSGSKWNMRKKRRRSNPWRILLLLVLIAAALYVERFVVPTIPTPFIPTPTPTRNPASFLLEAETFFQAGKLDQAEDAYLKAIEVNPLEANYFVNLARVQVFAGEYDRAEESASNAVLLEPNSALANAVYGWVLDFKAIDAPDPDTRTEMLSQAFDKVTEAKEIDPNSALVLAFYAEVLIDYDIGQYEAAIEAAQTAIGIDPNLMETHRAMGYVWESTGNYERAIDSYEAALRIHNNLPILHIAIGNMYQALGDVDLAVDSYLRAVALDPTDPDPLNRIALAEARVGNYGIASQYAADAVDKDPGNPRLHGNLGRMYYRNNEIESAIDELRLAVQGGLTEDGVAVQGLPLDDPNDDRVVEFYYTYALALAKGGQCDLANQIFQLLLNVKPDDEVVIANAQEGLVICGIIEPTATPEAE